jgi:uncharacterized iron-regulated membrane protein
MVTAKKVRFWYRVHKWTSLVCTLFLLSECLSGLPLIFGEEIFDLMHDHVRPAALPVNATLASLDSMVAAGSQRYPGQKILFLSWDEDEPRVFLDISPTYDPKPGQDHSLVFDAHTGKLLEEQQIPIGFLDYVFKLHTEMYVGLPGELFLGCVALTFLVALVSGVVVYGPFMRRLDFGTVRKNKHSRLRWFDLHNLIGIVTFTWAAVVGVTGAMNTVSTPLFGLWRAQELPRLLAPYVGKPMPQHFSSVDAAVATAQRALPGMKITSVGFPTPVDGSPRHYLIWTKGSTPVTSQLFTPALIDVESGQLTVAEGLPWYLRILEISRPLHFGNYGGLPLKIIWAFFDLALMVVLISGLYLWLSRRKTPIENELNRLVKLEELSQQTATAVVTQ